MTCKTHPDAPHGFVRGASHSEDRYVCECEFWEEPKMNERINELAEKACAVTRNTFGKPMNLDELEKFAELIVKECAKVCRDQPNVYALKADRDNCAIAIEEHFGVEE
jgi:hypothetical protein